MWKYLLIASISKELNFVITKPYLNYKTNINLTVDEFINNVIYLEKNTEYLKGINLNEIIKICSKLIYNTKNKKSKW